LPDTQLIFLRCRIASASLSCPTRRSSDLGARRDPPGRRCREGGRRSRRGGTETLGGGAAGRTERAAAHRTPDRPDQCAGRGAPRSEEHTSELQSREKLVCRLLLEKKKKKP